MWGKGFLPRTLDDRGRLAPFPQGGKGGGMGRCGRQRRPCSALLIACVKQPPSGGFFTSYAERVGGRLVVAHSQGHPSRADPADRA
ncbi:hypothetical protein BRN54_24195 [Xanthomonas oryzae pv. oryzae]|nr:hypothetical protein BRN54_24195 [Xanthomonas oryzae pv. oryzae]